MGQISDTDIISPFAFKVYKSAETIEKEKARIAERVEPIYKVSENVKFETIRKIDSFIELLAVMDRYDDIDEIQRNLRNNGYNVTRDNIEFLSSSQTRLQLHNYLVNIFNSTLSVGIYDASFTSEDIRLATNDSFRRVPLSQLFSIEQTYNRVIENVANDSFKPVLTQIAPYFIAGNVVVDREKTGVLIQEAYTQIDPVLTEVLENEEIIRKNRRITELDIKKLEAMYAYSDTDNAESDITPIALSLIGFFILSTLLLLGGHFSFLHIVRNQYNGFSHTVTYMLIVLLLVVMSFALTKLDNVPHILLPFALSVVLFALLFKPISGIVLNCICLFLVLPFLYWNIVTLSTLFLATLLLLIIMTKMKDTHDFLILAAACLITFLLVAVSITLLTNNSDYVDFLFYGGLSSIISITGVTLLSPIIEKKLNLTNKMILLQLQETSNPLLKRLATEAPGTYNHSLMVSNLAESAAAAIGANSLLAKVGGLYHDIGKLGEPDIYVENNSKAPEFHEKLPPYESTVKIKNHVLSGLTFARKNKLPEQVIDIIRQHHGESMVSFFYDKAKKIDPDADQSKYRYSGPKPVTKEAVLVMIADIVESTAKASKGQHSEESLKKIIDDTIKRLINDGQLADAPITLQELERIKSFMLPIIVGIYQKRIEYPGEKQTVEEE